MIQKYNQLANIHQLVEKQLKGTPDEFANRLGISKSSLYNYFDQLKQLGAEIKYCRSCMCFKYTNNFRLKITFETNEMTTILGGQQNEFKLVDFKKDNLYFNDNGKII